MTGGPPFQTTALLFAMYLLALCGFFLFWDATIVWTAGMGYGPNVCAIRVGGDHWLHAADGYKNQCQR